MTKRCGFTLAEVLITLGIIGVLAALTIPTLLKNIEKKDNYTKFLKAYSSITNVANTIRYENGGEFTDLATNTLELANLFKPYMKTIKFCKDTSESPDCYIANTDNVYNLQGGNLGSATPYYFAYEAKMITADGIMYDFELLNSKCEGANYTRDGVNENCGTIFIDINAAKLPNTAGKDVFTLQVNKYNIAAPNVFPCDKASASDYNGIGCADRALREGGIYYY